jgi:hypothetical protein
MPTGPGGKKLSYKKAPAAKKAAPGAFPKGKGSVTTKKAKMPTKPMPFGGM